MKTKTLQPDSIESRKIKPPIDKAIGFLEKLSILLLIIPLVVGFIYLFFPKGSFFFFFSLPLFIFLPIASLFALIVQFYRMSKERPSTSMRELILTIIAFALIINCCFWLVVLGQNQH